MFDVDSSEVITSIGKKHKLAIDEMGELASETGRVMLGLTHPNNFISNLAQRLGVDKQKAKEIAEDININIFKKVRESLKKIHGIEDGETPKDSPLEFPKGGSLGRKIESREEILREIERAEVPPAPKTEPLVPDILKGSTTPAEEKKEEEKIEKEKPPAPSVKAEQKYQSGMDPYRESVE